MLTLTDHCLAHQLLVIWDGIVVHRVMWRLQ